MTSEPLLPQEAIEYFNDALELPKNHLKAINVRYALEAIVETIFLHIAKFENSDNGWNRKNLSSKIDSLKEFFPEDIFQKIHEIRKITNKGAHQKGHRNLTDEDIQTILSNISSISEWVILSYIKKHGFITDSWIPTVLSTLKPYHRIKILHPYFLYLKESIQDKNELLRYLKIIQGHHFKIMHGDFNELNKPLDLPNNKKLYEQLLLTIDKLAMAYLKNRELEKSYNFIDECYHENLINDIFKSEMIGKLQRLNEEIDNLPIAMSLEDTRKNLEKVIPAIKENENSLFLTIFFAIVSYNNLEQINQIYNNSLDDE